MAVLPDPDRLNLWAECQRDASRLFEVVGVSKVDLRAAVDAADVWADANAAAYNSALPLPARTALTAKQKARLLMYVIKRRFEVA